MSLPKVLVVNQPFNNDTGGGITLTNLFKGWDKDKLAVACGAHLLAANIDTSICNNYFQLGNDEYYAVFPFKFLQKKYKSGKVQFGETRMQNLSVKKSKLRDKIIMNWMVPFFKYLGVFHLVYKSKLSDGFCRWIKEFDPDIIYVQAENRDRISFCIMLHSLLDKPMVFHMMDDWPSIISNKGILKDYWKRKIDRELRSLFDRTTLFMGISDYMAQEYKVRYNKIFVTFHNPIDIEFWKKSQKKDQSLENPPTLLYAGRIGLSIEKSLQIIAKTVQQINDELGIRLKFILCTQENPSWTKTYNCVEHKGFFSHEQMPSVLANADFLILPYDFSKESINYIKYSMPTKATEYMISGTPMIVFAPEDTAIVQYVRKNECAKIVTENSGSELAKAIKEFIQDQQSREKIAEKAKQTAETFHDGNRVRKDFRDTISSLVSQN